MINLLSETKKIIINSDIDGVLSGLILTNFLNCEIVGFSNSDDTVWIDESKVNSIYDAVYIDMFVPKKNVKCIDQHIVSTNEKHHQIIKNNRNKLNPNLDNARFHLPNSSYYLKYPFGTIHYIIAYLELQQIKVDLDFMKETNGLKFLDLLLRADDAMKTTVDSNYVENARNWWIWLYNFSNKSNSITTMAKYLYSLNSSQVFKIKKDTTTLLTSPTTFACTSPDGGYKIITNQNGLLLENVLDYFKYIAKSAGLSCFNTNLNLKKHVGKVNRISLNSKQIEELINDNCINGQEVFSYAFVRSSNREENFSYTIM